MRIRSKSSRWGVLLALLSVLVLLVVDVHDAEARRGGSFGGRRSGGGGFFGSRRSSPSYSTSPRTSSSSSSSSRLGGTRSTTQRRSSFGGTRLSSPTEYTRSYGIPRRTESVRAPSMAGSGYANYSVHRYGGMSDGFMMGYISGHTPWMWSTPFHPAFYYSRPAYFTNPDGTVEVFPPTFQLGRLILTLVVIGGIAYVIYRVVRRRSASPDAPQSSFS
jgi:hypothetical protein